MDELNDFPEPSYPVVPKPSNEVVYRCNCCNKKFTDRESKRRGGGCPRCGSTDVD